MVRTVNGRDFYQIIFEHSKKVSNKNFVGNRTSMIRALRRGPALGIVGEVFLQQFVFKYLLLKQKLFCRLNTANIFGSLFEFRSRLQRIMYCHNVRHCGKTNSICIFRKRSHCCRRSSGNYFWIRTIS